MASVCQKLTAQKSSLWIPISESERSRSDLFTLNPDGTFTLENETYPEDNGLLVEGRDGRDALFKQPGRGSELFLYLPIGEVHVFCFRSSPLDGSPRWHQFHAAESLGEAHETDLFRLTADGRVLGLNGTAADGLALSVNEDTLEPLYAGHNLIEIRRGVLRVSDRHHRSSGGFCFEGGTWWKLNPSAAGYRPQHAEPPVRPAKRRLRLAESKVRQCWSDVTDFGNPYRLWLRFLADGSVQVTEREFAAGSRIVDARSPDGMLSASSERTACSPLLVRRGDKTVEQFRYRNGRGVWQRRVTLTPISMDAAEHDLPCMFSSDGSLVFPVAKPQPFVFSQERAFTVRTGEHTILKAAGHGEPVLVLFHHNWSYFQFVFRGGAWYRQEAAGRAEVNQGRTLDVLREIPEGHASLQIGPVEVFPDGCCAIQTLSGAQAFEDGQEIHLQLDTHHLASRRAGYGNWLQVFHNDREAGTSEVLLTLLFYQGRWHQIMPYSGRVGRNLSPRKHLEDYGVLGVIPWVYELSLEVIRLTATVIFLPLWPVNWLLRKVLTRLP